MSRFIDIEKNINRQNEYISLLKNEIQLHSEYINNVEPKVDALGIKESILARMEIIKSKKSIFHCTAEIESKLNFIEYLKKYLKDCERD